MLKQVDIYSGLPVGDFGAGKLLQNLLFILSKHGVNYSLVAPPSGSSKLKKVLKMLSPRLKYFTYRCLAYRGSMKIRSGDVVIIFHPQSLGLKSIENYTKL